MPYARMACPLTFVPHGMPPHLCTAWHASSPLYRMACPFTFVPHHPPSTHSIHIGNHMYVHMPPVPPAPPSLTPLPRHSAR